MFVNIVKSSFLCKVSRSFPLVLRTISSIENATNEKNAYDDFKSKPNQSPEDEEVNEKPTKLYADHIPTTCLQKAVLTLGSSIGALMNPYRDDLVAVFGETTGSFAAQRMRQKMLADMEGYDILREKPRISSQVIDLDYLRTLPEDSFGHAYIKFLDGNKVTPDSRKPVQFVDDAELAYVIQRYREVHDFMHSLLGMPTNMLGEVVVKVFEAIQTGLPMCVTGALMGPVKFKAKDRQLYLTTLLPWAVENGFRAKFFMNIYFEKRWEQSLNDLRKEMNIKEPPLIKR